MFHPYQPDNITHMATTILNSMRKQGTLGLVLLQPQSMQPDQVERLILELQPIHVFLLDCQLAHIGYFAHHALGMDAVCIVMEQQYTLYPNHQITPISFLRNEDAPSHGTSTRSTPIVIDELPIFEIYIQNLRSAHPMIFKIPPLNIQSAATSNHPYSDAWIQGFQVCFMPDIDPTKASNHCTIALSKNLDFIEYFAFAQHIFHPIDIFKYCCKILTRWVKAPLCIDEQWAYPIVESANPDVGSQIKIITAQQPLQVWMEQEQAFIGIDAIGRIIIRQGHFNYPDPFLVLGYALQGILQDLKTATSIQPATMQK